LIVGGSVGAALVYALITDGEATAAKPRILCEADASGIATAFEEQGTDLNLLVDCQEQPATSTVRWQGPRSPPEYRCFIRVQLASNPYNIALQHRLPAAAVGGHE
jgi:hypothetical protein